jgi:hypothetical protein
MQALNPTTIVLAVLAPLMVWRLYTRFRRMVGRQRLSRVRPWITLIIFPMIVLLLSYATHWHFERLLWLAGGLLFGSLLGVYGLRQTRFESTAGGLFYTPHAHLGIALSLLLVGRLFYRLIELYGFDTAARRGAPEFAQSPLTLAIFGLLAGYYIVYALGLVRWRSQVGRNEQREPKATDA